MKKLLTLLLAAAVVLSLCACGNTVEPTATDTATESIEVVTPVPAAEEEPAPADAVPAEPLDFDSAFAAHDPADVVFTVEETPVTWQEFFYEIVYNASVIAAREGKPITDWNAKCSLFVDGTGAPVYTYEEIVLQSAINTLTQYHVMENHLAAAGIVMNEETRKAVADFRQQTVEDGFGGDEAAFQDYLEGLYCNEELWGWFNEVDALYSQGFVDFCGEMGASYPDSEVMTYAAGDPNGAWTEYVQLKMICIIEEETEEEPEEETSAEPASGEPGTEDTPSEEPSGELSAERSDKELAAELVAQLAAAEDRQTLFEELYALYNGEKALDYFPDGWCLYRGDTADVIYDTALSMAVDEVRQVSIDGAEVVLWKVPVRPDAGVTYDVTANTMYTLRYYAAQQDYGEMVNDWLIEGTATAEWAPGFEGFTLDSVFGA